MDGEADLKNEFVMPEELNSEQIVAIRKLARVIMDSLGCEYTQAAIMAYFEWFDISTMDKTEH